MLRFSFSRGQKQICIECLLVSEYNYSNIRYFLCTQKVVCYAMSWNGPQRNCTHMTTYFLSSASMQYTTHCWPQTCSAQMGGTVQVGLLGLQIRFRFTVMQYLRDALSLFVSDHFQAGVRNMAGERVKTMRSSTHIFAIIFLQIIIVILFALFVRWAGDFFSFFNIFIQIWPKHGTEKW